MVKSTVFAFTHYIENNCETILTKNKIANMRIIIKTIIKIVILNLFDDKIKLSTLKIISQQKQIII